MNEGQLVTPVPPVLPEVKVFWNGTAEGKLLLPRCAACQAITWYPRAFCPRCGSLEVAWVPASGRGTVYSYTVCRRGQADLPEYRGVETFVLAYVELEEGPRVMTNIVDCAPGDVRIGQSVELVFHPAGDSAALYRFRPVR